MSGEWIQMRVSLPRDPRVIAISDYLAVQRNFMDWMSDPLRRTCEVTVYEHVTRYVTVSVTVTGLLRVWGAANESGKVDGPDLVLHHSCIEALDEIAGIPCFGAAMASVDWAIQESKRGGKTLIRFPKFMEKNIPAEARTRSAGAERQARYRERHRDVTSNVTDNVTVTPTVQNSTYNPPTPLGSSSKKVNTDAMNPRWWLNNDTILAEAKRLTLSTIGQSTEALKAEIRKAHSALPRAHARGNGSPPQPQLDPDQGHIVKPKGKFDDPEEDQLPTAPQ